MIACATVLLGTLYPLLIDALGVEVAGEFVLAGGGEMVAAAGEQVPEGHERAHLSVDEGLGEGREVAQDVEDRHGGPSPRTISAKRSTSRMLARMGMNTR